MPVQLQLEVQPRPWSRTGVERLHSVAEEAVSSFTQHLPTADTSELTKAQQRALSQPDPPTLAAHKYGENYQVLVIYRIYRAFRDSVVIDVNVSMMFQGSNASGHLAVPDDFAELRSCCNRLVAELARHLRAWNRRLSISLKYADAYSKPTGVEARVVTFGSRLWKTLAQWLQPMLASILASVLLVVRRWRETGRWYLGDEIWLILLASFFALVMAFLASCISHRRIHKEGGLDYHVATEA